MAKSVETTHTFTFADLFAGIGGMRFAFEEWGGACVLTSEIDEHARKTYAAQEWTSQLPEHQYINDVVELGKLSDKSIPKFDVLVAGFPCQPYSIAGLRQGLHDEKGRGQVFLSMLEILRKKKPKAFLLENVKGLQSHDNGETLTYMVQELQKCGYHVLEPMVLNSMTHGGVPQNRERLFIVGFHKTKVGDVESVKDGDKPSGLVSKVFMWPGKWTIERDLVKILATEGVPEKYFYTAEKYECYSEIEAVATKPGVAYQWRRVYVRENKSGVCPALTANMGSGGHNVPLVNVNGRIRKLTPRECAQLQGFPLKGKRKFILPKEMADTRLYHQFGNSVTVPLISRLAKEISKLVIDDRT
jgi:DNA (cytosine-5)-methyltransferase 1